MQVPPGTTGPSGRTSERRGRRRGGLGGRDRPDLGHRGDDHVATVLRLLRVVVRVVEVGVVHHPGEQGGLRHRERGGRGAEVGVGGGLDAVDVPAELDDVEVAVQHVVLGHRVGEPGGQLRLADLAAEGVGPVGPLGGGVLPVHDVDQVVLDVLLGDRGAALGRAAEAVADQRPDGADRVDARLVVEPPVLDRDGGRLHGGGDRVDRRPGSGTGRPAGRSGCRRGRGRW